MSAKHINKYDFTSQGVLATTTTTNNNKMDKNNKKKDEAEDDSKKKGADTERTTEVMVESVETSTEFHYPPAWKDKLPKFPFIPGEDEVESEPTETSVASGWEDGQMPVFPFSSSAVKKTKPQK